MMRAPRAWIFLVLAVLALGTGCARSPEARKARHIERGDKYFAQEHYPEAIIEYQNVLRIDARNVKAIRQVGLAYYQLGEQGGALSYLLKAKELDPGQLEVHLRLGAIELLQGKLQDAAAEANFVLDKDPRNVEAFVLLTGAAGTPAEVTAAIARLEAVREALKDRARIHLALGRLYFQKGDVAAAQRAFEEAAAQEPKSVEAHMALADFYVARGDKTRAGREYEVVAGLAPASSPARIRLADFHILEGKPEEAKRVLAEITKKVPDYLPAWRRLAQISLAQRKYDECVRSVRTILDMNPSDLEGRLLLGQVHLARHETGEAIQEFQNVLKLEPRLAPARYQLALAQMEAGNVQQAKTELKEVITIAPGLGEATLLLAQLYIDDGALRPAIEELEKLIATQPSTRASELLGSAYLAKGEPAKAAESFRSIVATAPKDPRGPYLLGLALSAQGRRAEATKEFEASLALSPGFADPLTQLVTSALGEKRSDWALSRVERQVALAPSSGAIHYLLGTVYEVRDDKTRAEQAYLRALEIEPRLLAAYLRLATLYVASGKDDQALAELAEATKANPTSPLPLSLSGGIYERKGDLAKAREAYEKALKLNPRFVPAANNLAWLLSEHGGNKDRALQLAQSAKQEAPDEPYVSDTLGWILYKRGVYQRATSLLKDSAQKLPNNPEIQYHLGMAAFKAGDSETSRKALALAVNSPQQFNGKDDARKALAELLTKADRGRL